MSRKRESGCEYRKRAKERSEKNEELVKKIPKIDTFLQKGDKKQKVDSTELSEIQQEFDQPSTSGNNTSNKAESIMEIPEQVESCENPKKAFPEISGSSDNFSDDPALWDEITEELRQNFINRGIKQNIDLLDFEASRRNYNDRVRYCSKGLFKTRLKNAETHTRDFLIYSASTGRLYCLPCRLFNGKGPFASTGFNDWKNPITIEQHENSQNHKNCVLILLQRQKAAGQVDALHVKEYKREVQYWREVLKRVVAAIKALASRGLSFRGSTEVFGSLHNGNYMMLLEFLAEFDPFLADHIEKHGNQGRGNVSYLSSSICEEIIQIMATEVLKSIDQEVTEAKYYSISVDSTPDITHTDQLAFITRYNKEDGKPVERFLGFIPNPGHKAEDLYNAVIKMMEEHNFNFANCRGQSYDNAANMSGIYNGLQAKIKEISPLAYWIPCAAHSLNLVGEHAAGSCKASRDFFSLLQDIYVFFSISTARWGILMKHLTGPSVKRLSTTRWSARYEACNSMNQNWKEVVAALSEIDERDRSKTGSEAKGLKIKLTSLETAIMFAVWSPILERFDKVSEAIQKVGIGIDEVVLYYESLVDYILGLRDQFDRFEERAKINSGFEKYRSEERRATTRTVPADETRVGHTALSGRENFRVGVYLVIIDYLTRELNQRKNCYKGFAAKFSFLLKLQSISSEELGVAVTNLISSFPQDLDEKLHDECLHFKSYLAQLEQPPKTLHEMSTFIRSDKSLVQVFPYIDITIRMFLCTFATNCSAERSFSALKRILSYLRSSMSQERLNSLAVLCIEAELLKKLDFEAVLQQFAEKKARRKPLLV